MPGSHCKPLKVEAPCPSPFVELQNIALYLVCGWGVRASTLSACNCSQHTAGEEPPHLAIKQGQMGAPIHTLQQTATHCLMSSSVRSFSLLQCCMFLRFFVHLWGHCYGCPPFHRLLSWREAVLKVHPPEMIVMSSETCSWDHCN